MLRIAGAIIGGLFGLYLGLAYLGTPTLPPSDKGLFLITLVIACTLLGALGIPYVTVKPARWLYHRLHQVSAADLLAGALGLVLGLLIGALLAIPLAQLPDWWGKLLPIAISAFLGIMGMITAIIKKEEFLGTIGSFRLGKGEARESKKDYIIIDTSAIIDGRIADISQTGFIRGTLVIPRFILAELQHIADSADALRRNRGRRGLDMLSRLQKESISPVQIMDVDAPEFSDADTKLIGVARKFHCPLLTNDFNLKRVAELQGVTVLNINELANAVKPVVLPGEEMDVRIIQEGKEAGQGVGYLDDGTMIVVEGGNRFIGQDTEIVITRVLQTAAGRMIFAHPKEIEGKLRIERRS